MMNRNIYNVERPWRRKRRIEDVGRYLPAFQDYRLWQTLANEGMKLSCDIHDESETVEFTLLENRNGRYSPVDAIRITRETTENSAAMASLVRELTERASRFGDPRYRRYETGLYDSDLVDSMKMSMAFSPIPSTKTYSID